jgi:hypothetical protein
MMALGDLVRRASRHLLGDALDVGHGHAAKILAQQCRGALVLRSRAVGRSCTAG